MMPDLDLASDRWWTAMGEGIGLDRFTAKAIFKAGWRGRETWFADHIPAKEKTNE